MSSLFFAGRSVRIWHDPTESNGCVTAFGELEVAEAGSIILKTVYGHVKRLPQDYVGERHTVITKHLGMQDGKEWVEYEEVPGPDLESDVPIERDYDPERPPRQRKRMFWIQFIAPYPQPGEEERQDPDSKLTSEEGGDRP